MGLAASPKGFLKALCLFRALPPGELPPSSTRGRNAPPHPGRQTSPAQLTRLWHWCARCQPGKHAKQPLEKQNSPLSCACGMSMIYLGRNLPSVLISLKETVTKIATGRLNINQLPCGGTFPSFPLVLNPDFYPSTRVSISLAPTPQGIVAMFLHGAEVGIAVGRSLIPRRSREPRWDELLGQESRSQLGPGRELPRGGKEELFGRQGRSQPTQTAHPAKEPGLQISRSGVRITICWHRPYWLNTVCET